MAIDRKLIDELLTNYKKPEDIIGENGLLKQLTKAVLERALEAGCRIRRFCVCGFRVDLIADFNRIVCHLLKIVLSNIDNLCQ